MIDKKSIVPRTIVWLVLLVPSILLNIVLLARQYDRPEIGVPVIGVIDGDTIVVGNKDRVRLRQIDAPELGSCGGKEAKKELETLVQGKQVVIAEHIPDQMGRGMALLYTGRVLVNEAMLKSGWATYHHDTSTKEDALKAAAAEARAANRGIYGACWSTENKDNPTCTIKGNIDDNGVKTYFLPTCAQYKFTVIEKNRGEDYFCDEREARKAGYTKAETCGK